MFTEAQMKKLLTVLDRIADSLEVLSKAVDEDENELNVYVNGEVALNDEEDEDD